MSSGSLSGEIDDGVDLSGFIFGKMLSIITRFSICYRSYIETSSGNAEMNLNTRLKH